MDEVTFAGMLEDYGDVCITNGYDSFESEPLQENKDEQAWTAVVILAHEAALKDDERR